LQHGGPDVLASTRPRRRCAKQLDAPRNGAMLVPQRAQLDRCALPMASSVSSPSPWAPVEVHGWPPTLGEARPLQSGAALDPPRVPADGGVLPMASFVRFPSGRPMPWPTAMRRKRPGPPRVTDDGVLTMSSSRSAISWLMPLAKRRKVATHKGEWAELPPELLMKVLEAGGWLLETLDDVKQEEAGGWAGCKSSPAVRLVCAKWKAVHDAMVTRLLLTLRTTDEAMGMLARHFPAVASLEFKGGNGATALTDVSSLAALTSLDLSYCFDVTDKALRAVSNLPKLTSLDIAWCCKVTDAGLRAVIK
jgi:hypothetical protein